VTIRNTTGNPARAPLPRGKVLHLGPRMSAEVAASAVTHPPLVGMVEAGTIEIVAVGAERCAAGARWREVGPDGAARAAFRVWRSLAVNGAATASRLANCLRGEPSRRGHRSRPMNIPPHSRTPRMNGEGRPVHTWMIDETA